MEKPFSQRVARFLEIINYFLLIPTSLIEIVTIIYGLLFLVKGEIGALFFCFLITAIYAVGTLLLYGYYKHSRGKLSRQSFCLWIGTFVFNFIPFILMFWGLVSNDFRMEDENKAIWFYNIFAYYLAVILLAVLAFFSDARREFD